MRKNSNEVTIIGAGPAGAYMAISLAKIGYKVHVYEAREDLRQQSAYASKSFNITLYRRAIEAFKTVGIWEGVQEQAVQVTGNVCHFANKHSELYGFKKRKNEVLYTIQRDHLANLLLDMAEVQENITISFNKKCVLIDRYKKLLQFEDTKTGAIEKKEYSLLIGADGVNSVVRPIIQAGQDTVHKLEYTAWGYKEVSLTKEMVDTLGLNATTTHTWPRKDSLIIGFPNKDGSQTLMLNLPNFGYYSFSRLQTAESVKHFIHEELADLEPLNEYITQTFLQNPIGNLCTIYTQPWHYKDSMVLIGDAAHGILPFYGQGTGSSFEDCLLLTKYLTNPQSDIASLLHRYQLERKKNTDIIADLAKANFTELKDRDASPYHIMKQKMNMLISLILPSYWVPSLDTLIAHTVMPYQDAMKIYTKQERISKWLLLDAAAFILALPIMTMHYSQSIFSRR